MDIQGFTAPPSGGLFQLHSFLLKLLLSSNYVIYSIKKLIIRRFTMRFPEVTFLLFAFSVVLMFNSPSLQPPLTSRQLLIPVQGCRRCWSLSPPLMADVLTYLSQCSQCGPRDGSGRANFHVLVKYVHWCKMSYKIHPLNVLIVGHMF